VAAEQSADAFGGLDVTQMVPAMRVERASLRIIAASGALSDALGHAPEALCDMALADLLEPEDLAAFELALDRPEASMDEPPIWNMRRSSGELWPCEMRWHQTTIEGTKSVLIVLQDAGRRVALEEEREDLAGRMREKEASLRVTQQLFDIGVWKIDLDTRQLVWSENVHGIYGVAVGEFPDDPEAYVQLVHPDDRAEMRDRFESFLSSGDTQFAFRHRIVRPDGATIHVRGAAIVEEGDGRRWLTGLVQDITGEVTARRELREALRMQRMAGRMVRLGGWCVDLKDNRVEWTPETAAIHEEDDGLSPSIDDGINYYAPEHRDRIRKVFTECAREGIAFDEVLQIVTAKANRRWVHAIGEPVRDATGEIVAVEGAFQDVSELVAARDASSALSRRLRQTLESISDAFYFLDNDWRFAFLNGRAEALLRRGRRDLLGKNVWEEFPEAVGSTFQKQFERAVAEGQPVRFQEFYPPLEAWVEMNAYPTSEGLAVYFHDITKNRVRDEQLRLLETAVSRQNDILLITEAEPIDAPDGPKIVYVNEAFVKRTGYSREEAIGQTPRILQGPRTQRDELDRIRRALEKWRPVRAELINYTKSGEEFWLELDIVPVADKSGWFTHWVSIERDVTDRKRAEEALQVNEERFRLVARARGIVIWDWNVTKDREWWSEGLTEVFGHPPVSDGPAPGIWRGLVHPEDEPRVQEAFERLQTGQAPSFREQYRFRRADGSWATVEDLAFAMHDHDGRLIRVLGTMTDISERQHLEAQLRQAQKLEAVGQLTGGVAHDFNNLLTVILGNAEFLSESLDDQEDLRDSAELIAQAAERGAELNYRLLAFSRKQALEPRTLDANNLIKGMETLLRRTLPESIDIEIIRASGLWKIEIDPGQLESALLNLALNARDAMPDGGRLTIETANAALDGNYVAKEHDVEAGEYVVIIVSDSGHGISPDALPRLFEPFFTTKEVGKGSGLGLSMVYGFVKQSGGHIRVYSEPGEGTSFKLYFPRLHAVDAPVRLDRFGREIAGGTETILVVEDDALVRQNVIVQLKALGYRVLDAPAGPQALDLLHRNPGIDLLFTDIIMPSGMNGRELADAARALRPGLKVLFTSGYTENAIVRHGRLDPGIELLNKPYRREQLAEKVRKVLGQK
jgi:PAS domain S-box-containing protein